MRKGRRNKKKEEERKKISKKIRTLATFSVSYDVGSSRQR
jgi:hypothetical protein